MSSKQYNRLQKLCQGSFGGIYIARNKKNEQSVILKHIHIDLENEGIPLIILREISILKQLNENKHIIQLHDILINDDGNSIYLIFEHMTYDLRQHLDKYKHILSMNQIKWYLKQILFGIACIHSLKIIHRDLNPQNIVIDERTETIKICGFGLSRMCFEQTDCSMTNRVSSLWYRAPEICFGLNSCCVHMDMWSVACIFAEMLNNTPLFRGDSEICQIMHILKVCGTPNNNTTTTCQWRDYNSNLPKWKAKKMNEICPRSDFCLLGQHLLSQMLKINPNKRISAKQALRHDWFKSLELF